MPIKSYLAHPHKGKKKELAKELTTINNIEVIVAKNKDLLIVVTDTKNDFEENLIKEKLETIDSLKLLAMVSGYNTPKND